MTKLLYIGASPRGDKSDSGALATHFLGMVRAVMPKLEIDHIDLWNSPLPRFDGNVLEAKYMLLQGEAVGEKQSQAWQEITNIIDRFKRADRFVVATPM